MKKEEKKPKKVNKDVLEYLKEQKKKAIDEGKLIKK